MMSAPLARTSSGRIALTVAAVPTGMNAGVRISPRCMAIMPVRALPSVAEMLKEKRVTRRAYRSNSGVQEHSEFLAMGGKRTLVLFRQHGIEHCAIRNDGHQDDCRCDNLNPCSLHEQRQQTQWQLKEHQSVFRAFFGDPQLLACHEIFDESDCHGRQKDKHVGWALGVVEQLHVVGLASLKVGTDERAKEVVQHHEQELAADLEQREVTERSIIPVANPIDSKEEHGDEHPEKMRPREGDLTPVTDHSRPRKQ